MGTCLVFLHLRLGGLPVGAIAHRAGAPGREAGGGGGGARVTKSPFCRPAAPPAIPVPAPWELVFPAAIRRRAWAGQAGAPPVTLPHTPVRAISRGG